MTTPEQSFRFFVAEFEVTRNLETAFYSALRMALASTQGPVEQELSPETAKLRQKRDEDLKKEIPDDPNTLVLKAVSKLTGYPVETLVRPSDPRKPDKRLLCRAKWMAVWGLRRRGMTIGGIADLIGVCRETARQAIDRLPKCDGDEVDRALVKLFGTVDLSPM